MGNAVPGLNVVGGRCLRDRRIAVAAPGRSARGWSVVVAPCALHGRCDDDTREARFWTERVLPLLKDHKVEIVGSGGTFSVAVGLFRAVAETGQARAKQEDAPHAPKSAAALRIGWWRRFGWTRRWASKDVGKRLRTDGEAVPIAHRKSGLAGFG